MPQPQPIRGQIIELFKAELGEPEKSEVQAGSIYRWTLSRGRYDVAMYVSIDSPEYPDMAHVMISDGQGFQVDPVNSVVLYTLPEAERLLKRIVQQWKSKITE